MRKSWLICIKSPKKIYQKIYEWQTAIHVQLGKKDALYCCDNAKEYQRFEDLIHNDGLQMEYTTVYTLEKNGVLKRFNYTIVQIIRAMLIWFELPQHFWAKVACMTNYLRNFLPTGQYNLSLNKLWDGYKPEFDEL